MFFRFPDPGSDFFPSRIPDPNFFHPGPGSRIRIKEFKYFNPKKWFISSRKYDPGCSFRIPEPCPDFLPIPDPGSRFQDPGSRGQKGTGSWIRIRNTSPFLFLLFPTVSLLLTSPSLSLLIRPTVILPDLHSL
jgi:hypothetical protein